MMGFAKPIDKSATSSNPTGFQGPATIINGQTSYKNTSENRKFLFQSSGYTYLGTPSTLKKQGYSLSLNNPTLGVTGWAKNQESNPVVLSGASKNNGSGSPMFVEGYKTGSSLSTLMNWFHNNFGPSVIQKYATGGQANLVTQQSAAIYQSQSIGGFFSRVNNFLTEIAGEKNPVITGRPKSGFSFSSISNAGKVLNQLAPSVGPLAPVIKTFTRNFTPIVKTAVYGTAATAAIGGAAGLAALGSAGGTTMATAPSSFGQAATDAAQQAGGGTFYDVAAGGAQSATSVGSGGFFSDLGAGASNLGSSAWNGLSSIGRGIGSFLVGNKAGGSMSGSSLLNYLKQGYGYVSGHGGVLGMAGSRLESAGSRIYQGAGTVFNGVGKGVQYAGGFLGGTSTQQALQGLSIKNLGSEIKSMFSSNQKISGLESQLSLAKIKGMLTSYQPQSQAVQMTPASSPVVVNSPSPAPIQAGFGGGSTMEILLFVGVAMGMMMFLRGKK